jgi:hypothetical protein
MYLEHYKDKPIFNDQNIEDYKLIGTTPIKYAVADGTAFSVSYLIQQHFWNEYWGIGSSGQEKDGMTRQMVFVSLIKEKEQFRLKVKGTGL